MNAGDRVRHKTTGETGRVLDVTPLMNDADTEVMAWAVLVAWDDSGPLSRLLEQELEPIPATKTV